MQDAGDGQSWEQRQAAGEAVRQAKQDYEDLQSCKARTDYHRDRMASGDALSEDDLRDMKTDLDAMPDGLQAEFRSQGHDRAEKAPGPAGVFAFSAADLGDIAQTERATQPPRPDFPSP